MSKGSEFRIEFLAVYENPEQPFAALLETAVETLDLIELLESDVAARGVVVRGSRGQETVNTSISELRQQRLALARILKQLEPDQSGGPKSAAGKALARARWGTS